MTFITEPQKQIPVIYEADVCVIGGSCTGVFAAVRAARLGARVVIVENQNSFGGVATNGLVCVWHTFLDDPHKVQIISGLSEEVMNSLPDTDHIIDANISHIFNPVELKLALDDLLKSAGVKMYLHTLYTGVITDGDSIDAVLVENKNGRGAIKAKFFIDATGDGDVCRDLNIERYKNDNIQPPSYVFLMSGNDDALAESINLEGSSLVTHLLNRHTEEFNIEPDWGWDIRVPGLGDIKMRANTHVFDRFCADADELTDAELNGREKMKKICRLMRKYGDSSETYSLVADCSYIGIRDTWHYKTSFKADFLDLLIGKNYEDNILNGTYDVDIHDENKGITFMQFDGTYTREETDGTITHGSWREQYGVDPSLPIPTCYHLPFRSLVGERVQNFIAAGRMMNADTPAFGALRVMVNLNQIGEAAGVAAYLAIHQNKSVQQLDGVEVARLLSKGGSANLG